MMQSHEGWWEISRSVVRVDRYLGCLPGRRGLLLKQVQVATAASNRSERIIWVIDPVMVPVLCRSMPSQSELFRVLNVVDSVRRVSHPGIRCSSRRLEGLDLLRVRRRRSRWRTRTRPHRLADAAHPY